MHIRSSVFERLSIAPVSKSSKRRRSCQQVFSDEEYVEATVNMVGRSHAHKVGSQFDFPDHEHEAERVYLNTRCCASQISPISYAALSAGSLDLSFKPSRPHSAITDSQASSFFHKENASVYMASTLEELAHQLEEYA